MIGKMWMFHIFKVISFLITVMFSLLIPYLTAYNINIYVDVKIQV